MPRRVVVDYPLLITAGLLSAYGVAMVYSAGQTDTHTHAAGAYRLQIVWLGIGILSAYTLSRMTVRFFEWVTWPAYLFSLALLATTLVFGSGAGTAASSTAWLTVAGHRLGQPSELAKVTVVMMMARVLSAAREPAKSLLDLWKPGLVVFIPLLLILLQPDLGTSLAFVGIFFTMLFWSGVGWPLLLLLASPLVSLLLSYGSPGLWGAWFLALLALVLWYRPYLVEGVIVVLANVATGVVAPTLWEKLKPYQQHRFLVFLDPSSDPRNFGYHIIQSKVAIGSGGWIGQGFTLGPQKRLAFLPEQHTDFIFSVVGEELGFIGVSIALALFAYLFIRITQIATRANDPYSSLLAFGLLGSWFVHVFINIGMTLNLMPVTGIPLPFFSYGGSFMLASWIAVGLLLRVSGEGRGQTTHIRD